MFFLEVAVHFLGLNNKLCVSMAIILTPVGVVIT